MTLPPEHVVQETNLQDLRAEESTAEADAEVDEQVEVEEVEICEEVEEPKNTYFVAKNYARRGGKSLALIESQEDGGETVKELSRLSTCNTRFASTSSGDTIYTTGGFDRTGKATDYVETYNVGGFRARPEVPMIFKRAKHACGALDNLLIVCGGVDGKASDKCEKLDLNLRFEGGAKKWEKVCKMKRERKSFPMVACGDALYALGGMSDMREVLRSVEFFKVEDNRWEWASRMICFRESHAAVAFKGKIYVFGGRGDLGLLASAEAMDISTDQWTAIQPLDVPRRLFACVVEDKKIFCCGGEGPLKMPLNSVVSYDAATDEWREEQTMPKRRFGFSALSVRRREETLVVEA